MSKLPRVYRARVDVQGAADVRALRHRDGVVLDVGVGVHDDVARHRGHPGEKVREPRVHLGVERAADRHAVDHTGASHLRWFVG